MAVSVDFISIIRFIAAILIINSHSGVLYPDGLHAFVTGGSIGNSLFFFCSGYTLFLSNKDKGFGKWYVKRLTRIYPSVWIFLLFLCILGKTYRPVDFIITPFWFVNAIILFYLFFYWIVKYLPGKLYVMIGLLLIPYSGTFFLLNDSSKFIIENTKNITCLHWYYYFAIMLFGAVCARQKMISKPEKDMLYLIVAVGGYYVAKFFVMHYATLTVFQIGLPLFLLLICRQLYLVVVWSESKWMIRGGRVINYISKLTLDTYIVQFSIIGFYATTGMPFRLLFSFVTIILVADILSRCSSWIQKPLNVMIRKMNFR